MQWVPEGRDRKLHHKSERKLKPTLIQIIPMWPLKQKRSLRFAVLARIAVRAVVTLQSLLGNASWIDTDLFLLLYSHLCFRYYHSIIDSIDTQIFIQYLKFFISPSFPKKTSWPYFHWYANKQFEITRYVMISPRRIDAVGSFQAC